MSACSGGTHPVFSDQAMEVPSSPASPGYLDHQLIVVKEGEDENDSTKVPLLQDFKADTAPESKHASTFERTCLNACNAISGIGVLSMPYAFSLGGWLSLIIFVFIAAVCYYTGLLIQRCMDADPGIKTYPGIGEHAFGPKGKLVISVFMYLELYLVAVGFLILEGDNLDKLFPGTRLEIAAISFEGKQLFILLSALVILPTTWLQNLSLLAYVSAGGVTASAVLLCSLLWAGVADTGFHQKGRILDWSGLPSALGLFFMCFTCHAVFPTIRSSMKDTHRFPKVLSYSFVLCTLNYGLVAIFGYLMYGDDLKSQVTLNLPAGKFYTSVAIYTTLMTPVAKFALAISPIAGAIEQSAATHHFQGRPASLFIRSILLCGTVIIALAIPCFGSLMSFVGSFLCVVVSVIFPCVCYLKILGISRVGRTELAIIVGVVVVGIVVAAVGTCASLLEMINSSQ